MEAVRGPKMENDRAAQARGRYIRRSGLPPQQLLQPPLLPIIVNLGPILQQQLLLQCLPPLHHHHHLHLRMAWV